MAKRQTTLNIKQFDEQSQEQTAPVTHLPEVQEPTLPYSNPQVMTVQTDDTTKKRSVFTGKNFHNVDFEDEHETAMRISSALTKTKFADIIRTSVDEFLKKYYREGRLTEEGVELVQAYRNKTKF